MPDCVFQLMEDPLPQLPPFRLAKSSGAVVSFFGHVRDHNEGQRVVALEYSAYSKLAQKEGARILAHAQRNFHLSVAVCIHRLGVLQIGDAAVAIWVAAEHRTEAFLACRFIIDEVKANVPIWKMETYFDGSHSWVACPSRTS